MTILFHNIYAIRISMATNLGHIFETILLLSGPFLRLVLFSPGMTTPYVQLASCLFLFAALLGGSPGQNSPAVKLKRYATLRRDRPPTAVGTVLTDL